MLQELLTEMIGMYCYRLRSNTQYCGYGTVIDRIIEDCRDAGIPASTVRKLDNLAYAKAWARLDGR